MKQPKPEQYHEKKRHTEDQFPYNTYLCTIPDDFTEVPVHWHEEAEFIVIQKGSGTVLVDLTHYHVDSRRYHHCSSGTSACHQRNFRSENGI